MTHTPTREEIIVGVVSPDSQPSVLERMRSYAFDRFVSSIQEGDQMQSNFWYLMMKILG